VLTTGTLRRVQVALRERGKPQKLGRVARVTGQLVEAHVPDATIGDLLEILRGGEQVLAEVVGFRGGVALAMPLGDLRGVVAGAAVRRSKRRADLLVSDALLGRVVDPFGMPIDGGPPLAHSLGRERNMLKAVRVPVLRGATPVEDRAPIDQRFDTGVRTLDALLTCGRGQRVGIFAGAGVGKTVLIRQIATQSAADLVVLGLIGERGNEVQDLMASSIGARSIVVAATSDRSPMERVRGAQAATAIAEHYADRGKNVLLVIDSLTRFAMALREIGLAADEPPATKGYPPSVFSTLPRLLERVAPLAHGGSITGFYTVLVEGDDLADPVADSARSLLDGHLVLSRDLAARGHFPAVDVLASASRVANRVTTPEVQMLARRARAMLATRREAEELRSLGAYVPGANPTYDLALSVGVKLDDWMRQEPDEKATFEASVAELTRLLPAPAAKVKS